MQNRISCSIGASSFTYDIVFTTELFQNLSFFLSQIKEFAGEQMAIISDEKIALLYAKDLNLQHNSFLLTIPEGENGKTRAVKERIENSLAENGCSKGTCIIALGGGSVCDLAGYVAATYCRGLSLILIPTSLLAMVDAAIGGKNGINLPYGKNLIGAIYAPHRIFIDVKLLSSLPVTERKNGLMEMFKHGLIADADHFHFLEKNSAQILALEPSILEQVIYDSCKIKNEIIQKDPFEKLGFRHVLNFGHTVGHALEKASDYKLAHGTAVGIGMIAETYLSSYMGGLTKQSVEKIETALLPHLPKFPFDPQQLRSLMQLDKKTRCEKPHFVLLEKIGRALSLNGVCTFPVEETLLQKTLQRTSDALRSY